MRMISTCMKDERMNTIEEERRNSRRYAINLEVRWKLVRRRRVIDSGVGHTLDLSSRGIRFHAGRDLPTGMSVYLAVSWPARLDNVAPMQLAIQGPIVRSGEGWAAIRTAQHEFRTLAVGVPAAHHAIPSRITRMRDTPIMSPVISELPKLR